MAEAKKEAKAPAKPRKTAAKKAAAPTGTDAVAVASEKPNGNASETRVAKSSAKPVEVSREEIERLAHQYWVERGRPHGSHEQDWYRAEQELRKRAS